MSKLLAMMMKPKNYMYATIKGSLTENPSGVFSGFSSSNYLKLQNNNFYNNFIMKLKFTTGEITINNHIVRASNDFYIRINNSDKKITFGATHDTNWDIANQIAGITTMLNNTTYYLIFSFDGAKYKISLSTDDINYTDEIVVNSSLIINNTSDILFGVALGLQSYWRGSIDLNQSYIKIANTKYQLQAVVGYTVVDSPTIVDGIISGFSATSYIQTSQVLKTNNNFEFYTKINVNDISTTNPFFRSNGGRTTLRFDTLRKLNLIAYDINNTYFSIEGTTTLSLNTNYYIRFKIYNNIATVSYSLDGVTFIDEISHSFSATQETTVILGSSSPNYLKGTIDLNETYIKINNKLWFNGQPA